MVTNIACTSSVAAYQVRDHCVELKNLDMMLKDSQTEEV